MSNCRLLVYGMLSARAMENFIIYFRINFSVFPSTVMYFVRISLMVDMME